MTPTTERVLQAIRDEPSSTISELVVDLGYADDEIVRRAINRLLAEGLIEAQSPPRGQRTGRIPRCFVAIEQEKAA